MVLTLVFLPAETKGEFLVRIKLVILVGRH
jgi:hypothetical protein